MYGSTCGRGLYGSLHRERRGLRGHLAGLMEVHREVHREGRALARHRLHLDPAVVQLHEVPREREPEAGAASWRALSFLGLIELLEDPLQLVGRDADALVDDVDAYGVDAERRIALRNLAAL